MRVDSIPTASADQQSSVHFSVCCVPCGAAVGRLYTQLPQALAPALSLLCLEDACCLSYELGAAEVRAPAGAGSSSAAVAAQQHQQQQGQPRDPRMAGGSGGLAGGSMAGGVAGTDPGLVLELLQRVEQLEATLCTVSNGGQGAGLHGEAGRSGTCHRGYSAVACVQPNLVAAAYLHFQIGKHLLPPRMQTQAMLVMHDEQLRELQGYRGDGTAAAAGG